MTTAEKRKFVRDLMRTIQSDVLGKVEQMPEGWDGFELRRYLADKFAENAAPLNGKRLREYKNTVLVDNL